MQEANTLEAKKGEVLKKGREKTKAPRAFFRSPFHPLVVAYVYRTTDKTSLVKKTKESTSPPLFTQKCST